MEIGASDSKEVDSPKIPILPQVQNFLSYRDFLKAWFAFKKSQRSSFSFRRFSALLGLKSPNFMQLVLSGQRNLSHELAIKVAQQAGLKNSHRQYFLALVGFEQAADPAEKEKFERTLLGEKRKLRTSHIEKSRQQILSEWYHMLVRETLLLKNFEPSGEFIAQALGYAISPEQAEDSLRLLLECSFIRIEAEERSGQSRARYVQSEPTLDTGDYILDRVATRRAHAETLRTWAKKIESASAREAELGLLQIPVRESRIPELKERIRKFQDEIIGWLCDETEADKVVQLGTYLIPFEPEEK